MIKLKWYSIHIIYECFYVACNYVILKKVLYFLQTETTGESCTEESSVDDKVVSEVASGETSGQLGETRRVILNDRIENLNKGLSILGSSPIKKKKLTQTKVF